MRINDGWRRLTDRLPGFRKRRKGEDGQALVEFALVIPLLLVVLFGIVQFGIMMNTYINVSDAARSGARQLALEQGNNDPCDPAMQVATTAGSSAQISTTNVTITFASPTGGATSNDYCLATGASKTPMTSAWPNASNLYPANNNTTGPNYPGAEVEGDTATMTVTKIFPLSFFGFKLWNINLSASASDAVE
jgi:Flp pilus assembly protein TadG